MTTKSMILDSMAYAISCIAVAFATFGPLLLSHCSAIALECLILFIHADLKGTIYSIMSLDLSDVALLKRKLNVLARERIGLACKRLLALAQRFVHNEASDILTWCGLISESTFKDVVATERTLVGFCSAGVDVIREGALQPYFDAVLHRAGAFLNLAASHPSATPQTLPATTTMSSITTPPYGESSSFTKPDTPNSAGFLSAPSAAPSSSPSPAQSISEQTGAHANTSSCPPDIPEWRRLYGIYALLKCREVPRLRIPLSQLPVPELSPTVVSSSSSSSSPSTPSSPKSSLCLPPSATGSDFVKLLTSSDAASKVSCAPCPPLVNFELQMLRLHAELGEQGQERTCPPLSRHKPLPLPPTVSSSPYAAAASTTSTTSSLALSALRALPAISSLNAEQLMHTLMPRSILHTAYTPFSGTQLQLHDIYAGPKHLQQSAQPTGPPLAKQHVPRQLLPAFCVPQMQVPTASHASRLSAHAPAATPASRSLLPLPPFPPFCPIWSGVPEKLRKQTALLDRTVDGQPPLVLPLQTRLAPAHLSACGEWTTLEEPAPVRPHEDLRRYVERMEMFAERMEMFAEWSECVFGAE